MCDQSHSELVKADVDRLLLLDDILDVVLDTDLDDAAVGSAVRDLPAGREHAGLRDTRSAKRPSRISARPTSRRSTRTAH